MTIEANHKEKRSEFVANFIQTESKNFPDSNACFAAALTAWEELKADAEVIIQKDNDEIVFAQSKFGGKKRSDLKDSDFLYPEDRSFPIMTSKDVKDAVRSFGRSKGKDFEDFKSRLKRMAKRKGLESALPKDWKSDDNKK